MLNQVKFSGKVFNVEFINKGFYKVILRVNDSTFDVFCKMNDDLALHLIDMDVVIYGHLEYDVNHHLVIHGNEPIVL